MMNVRPFGLPGDFSVPALRGKGGFPSLSLFKHLGAPFQPPGGSEMRIVPLAGRPISLLL